jgi:protein TonB
MNGTLNLKIFFSISLGIHLLFLSIVSFLFPNFKIDPLPNLNIEVSLLPFITEEKPILVPFSPPKLKTQIKKDEKNSPQKESEEEPSFKKELEPESPQPVQTVAKNIPVEEQKSLPLQNKKRETGDEKEPAIQATDMASPSDSILTFEKEGLTMTMPQSKVSHANPHSNPVPIERTKNVAKLQPPVDGEILFVQPKYGENPKPFYPQEARKKGYEGEVLLKVEVLSDGRVGQIEVKSSSGYESLDRSALTTVKQWKFIPAKKGESAISYWVNIPIKFQLQ